MLNWIATLAIAFLEWVKKPQTDPVMGLAVLLGGVALILTAGLFAFVRRCYKESRHKDKQINKYAGDAKKWWKRYMRERLQNEGWDDSKIRSFIRTVSDSTIYSPGGGPRHEDRRIASTLPRRMARFIKWFFLGDRNGK